MKKTILAVLAMGALSCALFSQQVQAAQISGDVAMGGQIQFNSSLGTATTVTHWISVGANNDGFGAVEGVTGDLATFISPLDEAAMANLGTSVQAGLSRRCGALGVSRSIWLRRLLSLNFSISLMLRASEL